MLASEWPEEYPDGAVAWLVLGDAAAVCLSAGRAAYTLANERDTHCKSSTYRYFQFSGSCLIG